MTTIYLVQIDIDGVSHSRYVEAASFDEAKRKAEQECIGTSKSDVQVTVVKKLKVGEQ